MPAAPAHGAKVGVRILPNGRWMPAIAHRLLPDGTMTFMWPPRFGRGEKVLMAFSLKHDDWEWKPGHECTFTRACSTCRANGAKMVDGHPRRCPDCGGAGDKADRRPFE